MFEGEAGYIVLILTTAGARQRRLPRPGATPRDALHARFASAAPRSTPSTGLALPCSLRACRSRDVAWVSSSSSITAVRLAASRFGALRPLGPVGHDDPGSSAKVQPCPQDTNRTLEMRLSNK